MLERIEYLMISCFPTGLNKHQNILTFQPCVIIYCHGAIGSGQYNDFLQYSCLVNITNVLFFVYFYESISLQVGPSQYASIY